MRLHRRFASLLALVLLALLAPALRAAEPAPLPIREIKLDNGLRVFVLERAASPTFAGYFQFGVGGAMDPKGASGIAHLLEHMMFKGTTNVGTLDPAKEEPIQKRISELWHRLHAELDRMDDPFAKPDQATITALREEIAKLSEEQKKYIVKNEYDELMTRAGGVSENASTSNDVTNYFIQLPSNQLELWFYLESDRLLNPVFREFYSERDVVHEERRTSTENSAEGLAWEGLMSLLFPASPYGVPVVGWPHDVDRLTEENALAYFKTYYSPSNCVMVLVGDVKTADIERLAKKYFAPWKQQQLPPLQVTAEPDQRGERRRVVEFDSEPSVLMGWPAVAEGHADQYPLQILGSILGGLASSRLDRTMVQRDRIATSAYSGVDAMKHAGYVYAGAQPAEGKTIPEIEAAIQAEIAAIQKDGVTADELERAKVQVEASRVRGLKSNLGQAFRIGGAVGAAGTTDYIREYERRIVAVTADQVKDVATRYLVPSRICVVEVRKMPGVGAPGEATDEHHRGGEQGERGAKHSKGFEKAMALIRGAKPVELKIPQIGKDVDRTVLPCGATVFIAEDHSAPSVEMSFRWLGGSNTMPVSKLARMSLASQLWNEGGTQALDPIALSARKEELGMSFSSWIGGTESGASFWSLSRNFDDAFAVALDVIEKPRFDEERLGTIKGQFIDQMKRRYDYPGWGVALIEEHVLYGDHPRFGYEPTKAEIEAVTPQDVREAWETYVGSDNLFITVVGDFDKAAMLRKIEASLCGFRKAKDTRRDFLPHEPVIRPGLYVIEKEVSAPAVSFVAEAKVDRTAPIEDHAAIDILNDILGGSGFRSRLMERVRSDEGLTYGIYSYFGHEGRPGSPGRMGAGYETKQASLLRSVDIVREELRKMATGPVGANEVEEQVDAWRNRFIFQFTSPFYSVARLMANELDDRPYDWDEQYLHAVQKVTAADVERAAKKYLRPDDLTISVFGTPTEEDRKAMAERYKLTVLPKEAVFKGGYDVADEPEEEPAPAAAPAEPAKAAEPTKTEAPAKKKTKAPSTRRSYRLH